MLLLFRKWTQIKYLTRMLLLLTLYASGNLFIIRYYSTEKVTHIYKEVNMFPNNQHGNGRGEFYRIPKTDVYIYKNGIIYDERIQNSSLLRIISLAPKQSVNLFCHVAGVYDRHVDKRLVTKVVTIKATIYTSREWLAPFCKWKPAVLLCPLERAYTPHKVIISQSSTLNAERKRQWLLLAGIKALATKHRYGVCLSSLFHLNDSDIGLLIEWMEMHKILGADRIMLYGAFNVSSGIRKVLNYYVNTQFLNIVFWNLPVRSITTWDISRDLEDPVVKASMVDNGKAQCVSNFGQHLQYLDCLYQNMATFDYLFFYDIDEYVIPHQHNNWHELFAYISSNTKYDNSASFTFAEAHFCSIKQMSTSGLYSVLGNVKRIKRFRNREPTTRGGSSHGKSVIRPLRVVNMYIHEVEEILDGYVAKLDIASNIARLHHYRQGQKCKDDPLMKYETLVRDSHVSKYLTELHFNVKQTLANITQKFKLNST